MGKMWVAGWRKWVARKWVARWRLVGARGWGRAGRARAGRNFGWEMPRAVCREGVCGCAGRHCAELPVLGAASEGAHGKERRALREVPFQRIFLVPRIMVWDFGFPQPHNLVFWAKFL